MCCIIYTHFVLTCGSVQSACAVSLVCFIKPPCAVTAHFQKLLQCPVARFQLYPCMQLAAREAALDKIWDSAVVESANSLVNFSLYFEEDDGQAGVSEQWHAQGKNTQTHSHVVILCAVCTHALCRNVLTCYMANCVPRRPKLLPTPLPNTDLKMTQTVKICRR